MRRANIFRNLKQADIVPLGQGIEEWAFPGYGEAAILLLEMLGDRTFLTSL
jgi:hypothetical protein